MKTTLSKIMERLSIFLEKRIFFKKASVKTEGSAMMSVIADRPVLR